MNALIQSIQVGRKHVYRIDDGTTWESAIGKSTIAGSVEVHCEGLEGDEQADRIHHGGPDKAILVYSSEHFAAWRQEFPEWSVVGGTFGENFTVNGLAESLVCIGDVYRVGTCRLQVSQPRQPANRTATRVPAARGLHLAWKLTTHRPAELPAGHRG